MELPICVLVDPAVARCDEIIVAEHRKSLLLLVETVQATTACPQCSHPSARVHSRYQRTLADLPWAKIRVTLQVRARRFFCDNPDCPQRIFMERIPTIAAPWARRTQRLTDLQQQLGLLVGASVGAVLCTELACPTGIDALIHLMRCWVLPERPVPRVLGVDDWAKRKRHCYGTLLVDHERQWVVDVLDDRTPESLARWLQDHPGVEVVTRDRDPAYAQAIRTGAPEAVQVADRWHSLKNLTDAITKWFQDHQPAIQRELRRAGLSGATPPLETRENSPSQAVASEGVEAGPLSRGTAAERRRQERAAEAHRLHQQGWTARAIARQLNCCPKTVSRYLQRHLPLAPRQGRRTTKLEAFQSYLLKRWNEGCHNAAQLFRELCQQGYRGSVTILRSFVATLRSMSGVGARSRLPGGQPLPIASVKRLPSCRRLAWLTAQLDETLDAESQHYVELVRQINPALQAVVEIARSFTAMVCRRQPERLDAWLDEATQSGLCALRRLANGLRDDYQAVRAALTLPWSNGRTEGYINRLKCIKRQMYGRAKLDLLRCRVMAS